MVLLFLKYYKFVLLQNRLHPFFVVEHALEERVIFVKHFYHLALKRFFLLQNLKSVVLTHKLNGVLEIAVFAVMLDFLPLLLTLVEQVLEGVHTLVEDLVHRITAECVELVHGYHGLLQVLVVEEVLLVTDFARHHKVGDLLNLRVKVFLDAALAILVTTVPLVFDHALLTQRQVLLAGDTLKIELFLYSLS